MSFLRGYQSIPLCIQGRFSDSIKPQSSDVRLNSAGPNLHGTEADFQYLCQTGLQQTGAEYHLHYFYSVASSQLAICHSGLTE